MNFKIRSTFKFTPTQTRDVGVRRYVCIYNMCIHIYQYCVFMYVCTYVCMYVCMYVCICVYIYIHIHTYVHISICTCISMHTHTYICMYVCIHQFIYISGQARQGQARLG